MDAAALSKTPLFRGSTPEEVEAMLECLGARMRTYDKGGQIYRARDAITALGIVLSGQVLIETDDFWGNTTVLDSVGPGEIFAETYACTPGEPLMVNAVAVQGTQVLFLEMERVLHLCPSACQHHSGLLRNLLAIFAQKNLNLSRKIFHTTPKTIRGRLLSYLSAQAIRSSSRCVCLPFNRQQLADYLNVDRSALSHELGKMMQDGLIRVEKNRFWLLEGQLPAERG